MAGKGMEIEVDTAALVKLRHELDIFARDLKKSLDKRLRKVAADIVSGAKASAPVVTGRMRGSYRVKRRARGDDVIYSAIGASRPAAILEFAAVPHTKRGTTLISTLNSNYGAPGRFLWDAYDRQVPSPPEQVKQIIEEVGAEFEQRVRRF